jgi:hypothetical protein
VEVERDQHRFRAEEAADTLGQLRRLIGANVVEASPVVGSMSVSQSTGQSEPDPTPDPTVAVETTAGAESSSASLESAEEPANVGSPIYHPSTSPAESGEPLGQSEHQGQSEPHPTQSTDAPLPTVDVGDPGATDTATVGSSKWEPSSPQGQSETYPTSAAPSQASPATSNLANGPESAATDGAARPYEGHPSWDRPNGMSWEEWKAKGGHLPYWMVGEDVA